MDLDELIKISEQAPEPAHDARDLELAANTHVSRLKSGSADVAQQSFRELAFVAKLEPGLVRGVLGDALDLLAAQPASPAAPGAFTFLSALLGAAPDEFCTRPALSTACEAVRVQVAGGHASVEGFSFILALLASGEPEMSSLTA